MRPPMMIERLPEPSARTLSGTMLRERVVDRVDQRVHGRIVGVDRRREARIEHRALARRDGEGAQQALARRRCAGRSARSGNRRRPPAPAAGGRWPGPWSGRPSRRNRSGCGRPSSRRRRGCAPAFRDRCRRRRRSARPRSGRPSIRRRSARSRVSDSSNSRSKQARIFALPYLAASSLSAPLAEAVGAELAADVAEHQLGRAAVGGDDALDVVARLVAALVAHRAADAGPR